MAVTVTDILNQWDQIGVFSYVIPFLLMFAVIFAILQKTKILTGSDQENKGLLAIISISISLLALQFDLVPAFFGIIFPHFGVGLSIFLVLLILLGFFYDGSGDKGLHGLRWIGILTGIGVVLWTLASWDDWIGYGGFSFWFQDYFWSLVILGGLIGIIYWAIGGSKGNPHKPSAAGAKE